jgi:type II secretory pathway component PulM
VRAQPDRYEPLPGLLELPRFLFRKLSPRGRRIVLVAGAMLLVAAAVGLAIGIPAIVRDKKAASAADARKAAHYRAERLAELRRQVRPVSGRGPAAHGLTGAAAVAARSALRSDLLAAVRTDSLRRARTGEFAVPTRSVQCEPFPVQPGATDPATQLRRATARYSCLAVTAVVKRSNATTGSSIGYPYRALVDFPRGRYTFCRISERPGEMLLGRDIHVNVPIACGGLRG